MHVRRKPRKVAGLALTIKEIDNIRFSLARGMADQGMKQRDLAERVGVPPTYVSWWLSGSRLPSFDQLKSACAVLGLDPASLVPQWLDGPGVEEEYVLATPLDDGRTALSVRVVVSTKAEINALYAALAPFELEVRKP